MKVSFNKQTTASIDIDVQKGFTPICPKELPVEGGDTLSSALNSQAELATFRIGTKDSHCREALHTASPESPQFSPVNEKFVDIKWNQHCVMGTEGAELIEGLPHWSRYDYFVWKGMEPDTHPYSAVYHNTESEGTKRLSTGLVEYLKANGVTTVLLGGLAFDYCVKATALDLAEAGFTVIVNKGASKGIAESTSDEAQHTMELAGITVIDSLEQIY
jgi:nicotinamidase/pyrazinamidase